MMLLLNIDAVCITTRDNVDCSTVDFLGQVVNRTTVTPDRNARDRKLWPSNDSLYHCSRVADKT